MRRNRKSLHARSAPRVQPDAAPFLAQAEADIRAALATFGATPSRWYLKLMIPARAQELARLAKEQSR